MHRTTRRKRDKENGHECVVQQIKAWLLMPLPVLSEHTEHPGPGGISSPSAAASSSTYKEVSMSI
jgi:hypothetical protein